MVGVMVDFYFASTLVNLPMATTTLVVRAASRPLCGLLARSRTRSRPSRTITVCARLRESEKNPTSQLGEAARGGEACSLCADALVVACEQCDGMGTLPAGGYHAKNPLPPPSAIVGSRWTAHTPQLGWRHFECIAKGKRDGVQQAQLAASMDRANARMWLPLKQLRDRSRWSAGWKSSKELDWTTPAAPGERWGDKQRRARGLPPRTATQKRKTCTACDGSGQVECPACVGKEREVRLRIAQDVEKKLKAYRKARAASDDENAASLRSIAKKNIAAARDARRK